MKKSALLILSGLLSACMSEKFTNESRYDSLSRNQGVITVVANDSYNKVSHTSRLLFGQHFRAEWATPVGVEVLNLDSLSDKLTPTRLGGGMQTKSLRLESEDGREYVLRSINKDPSRLLPKDVAGTFAQDILQDQISSSNPYAPLVVAELAEAAHIFHTTPKIVFVERSAQLGEFNDVVGNTLCLFEERPVGNQENNPAFGYSKKVINSEKLFEKIFQDKNHLMDERAFLKARLFDMWIGDWDRHEDQWVWASFKSDGRTTYKPIPRDRDQAFAKLDGVIPQIAARKWAVRKTQNFDYTIRDINGLNHAANSLDRLFTTKLSEKEWVGITQELQRDMSDEKIEKAFSKLPEEIRKISAADLIEKLKKRRNDLLKYSLHYYKFLTQVVSLTGSNKDELFEVIRLNEDYTSVTMYEIGEGGEASDTVYNRIFRTSETEEIRLYGLGGNDKFVLRGKVKRGILVRVIGGEDVDYVLDESSVAGISDRTIVYDQGVNVENLHKEVCHYKSADSLQTEYNRKSFRYDWLAPKLAPGYNADDGVYLGGGIVFKKHRFGKQPFGSIQSIWGNYAFATGAYNFQYDGQFREVMGKWDLQVTTKLNAPHAVYNFYGMGNETGVLVDDWKFYRVRLNQFIVRPSLRRQYGRHLLTIGLNYQAVKLERTNDRFITSPQSSLTDADFKRKYYGGIHAGYQFSSLDNVLYPTRGEKLEGGVDYVHNLNSREEQFVKLSSEFSTFRTVGRLTLAFRMGGSTLLGNDYEFYQASTLGGFDNLRGYRRTRFSGKSSVFQNTELRMRMGSMRGYFMRGHYGLLSFFDAGRVWISNEKSNEVHYGYGGGIWFLPYNKVSFTATYGVSAESNLVNIKAGFLF